MISLWNYYFSTSYDETITLARMRSNFFACEMNEMDFFNVEIF